VEWRRAQPLLSLWLLVFSITRTWFFSAAFADPDRNSHPRK
jgi:hypothetical protein